MNSQAVIIGRTNVGKSLLFNKLTKQKKSLVIDYHGVTKDINHGYLKTDKDNAIKIFDTSGFTEALSEDDEIYTRTVKCIKKSQLIIYILSLDALPGITSTSIRRVWPDKLVVMLSSDIAFARSSKKNWFINPKGDLFESELPVDKDILVNAGLPKKEALEFLAADFHMDPYYSDVEPYNRYGGQTIYYLKKNE